MKLPESCKTKIALPCIRLIIILNVHVSIQQNLSDASFAVVVWGFAILSAIHKYCLLQNLDYHILLPCVVFSHFLVPSTTVSLIHTIEVKNYIPCAVPSNENFRIVWWSTSHQLATPSVGGT